jgi:hypothetical protein
MPSARCLISGSIKALAVAVFFVASILPPVQALLGFASRNPTYDLRVISLRGRQLRYLYFSSTTTLISLSLES